MAARDRLSYVLGLRLLGPFRHSEYRRLIAALAVSVIGAGMWTVVMPMQVLELNDDDAQGLASIHRRNRWSWGVDMRKVPSELG
jgi:hypothetical protein